MPGMLGRGGPPRVLLNAIGSRKFTLVFPLGPGSAIPNMVRGGSGTPGTGGARQGAGQRSLNGTQSYIVFKTVFTVG